MITMDLSDFNHIALDEIQKQRDILLRADDSLDTKIGIILGFMFLVIAQILLNKDFINLVAKDFPHILFIVFAADFIFIIISVFLGIKAYSIRIFDIGPDISDIIQKRQGYEVWNLNKAMLDAVGESIPKICSVHKDKARCVNIMLSMFFIGVIVLALIEISLNIL